MSGRGRSGATLALILTMLGASAQAAAGTQAQARAAAYQLLERVQNVAGRRDADLPPARAAIQRGLRATADDPVQHALWLRALWRYWMLADDHLRAGRVVQQAADELARAHANPSLIADALGDVAYSQILRGDVAAAKNNLRKAIVMANAQADRALLADLYYAIGDAYRKTGDYLVSQRYFAEAHRIDRAGGDALRAASSQLKLGTLARDEGDVAHAIDLHEQALAVLRRARDYRALVAEIELANDHADAGQAEAAAHYARAALDDGRALPEQRIDANILLLRVANDRLAARMRTHADRDDEDERKVATFPASADARAAALLRGLRTLFAESTLRQGSALARPTHQLRFAVEAIRYHRMHRDIAAVERYGSDALALVQQVARASRASADDYLAWMAEAGPFYSAYVEALYALDRPAVFGVLEDYYAQSFDYGAARHASVLGKVAQARALDAFERYLTRDADLADAGAVLAQLQSEQADTERLRAAQQAVDGARLQRQTARDDYLALTASEASSPPLPPSDAGAVHRLPALASGDLYLRYFVQEQVSFCVALATDDLEYVELPPRSAVEQLIADATKALQADHGGEARALSALAQLLPLKFLNRHPEATRLVIAPDDATHGVPFAAIDLATDARRYAPLIDRFAIVRTRSATRYYAARPLRATAQSDATPDIVVFADPLFGGAPAPVLTAQNGAMRSWTQARPRLPSTAQEAQDIARIFADRFVQTFLGNAATNDVLMSEAVRSAKILHIATHTYFSAATPETVGIATSGRAAGDAGSGGFLTLSELFAQPFYSNLVIVSGCDTMRGRAYNGWGVQSLAEGFIAQGAGSALGTLWSVADLPTAKFMDDFYHALHANGGNSSMALQSVQRAFAGSDLFAEPALWAGFALESASYAADQHAL